MKPNGDYDDKRVGDTEVLSVDYSKQLGAGETIISATWSVRVLSGVDAAPGNMLQGGSTTNGPKVSQMLTGGVAGVYYSPLCTALTSLGQTLTLPDPGRGGLLVVP